MADSSPLAGLLDRAGKVFSLAGNLGRAFHEEHQGQGRQIDPAGWNRHAPDFDNFCAALLDLRDAMQNPPDGFAPVAESLMEAARIAKGIRDAMQRADCRTWAAYLEFFPHLNSACEDGWRAVKEVTKARRLDDPFAFVDEPAASNPLDIDTTPATPKPPIQFVEAAARDIPSIMANVPPRHDGAIELVASHLTKRLQDARHTLAAAEWAVHESVRAGRLQPGLIEVELPSFGRVVGGTMRHWGGPDDRRMEWTGGERGTIGIPKGKPAPFDNFKVTATESLWTWWHSAAVETPTQAEPVAPAIKAGEAFRRMMETDPETRAGWERARGRLQAFAKAMQEAMESPEYKTAQEAERRRWQELADAIRANIQWAGDELTVRHFARPETIEDWEHLARIVEIPAETIRTGNLTPGEIFACALAWADRQKIKAKLAAETNAEAGQGEPAAAAGDTSTPTKAKRSTERGEGRAKLIAALTKHHKYADGGCLNLEPIGNNELARLAGVSESTASAFFNKQFDGHTKYRAICGDATRLVAAIKLLNQEFAPHHLFGSKPPDEGERDDDEE